MNSNQVKYLFSYLKGFNSSTKGLIIVVFLSFQLIFILRFVKLSDPENVLETSATRYTTKYQSWESIGKKIAEYSMNNFVILTICNKGMAIEWLQQWYVSARRNGIENLVVIATDEEAYYWIHERIGERAISAQGLIPLLSADRWSNADSTTEQNLAYNWRSMGYESVVTQRATILSAILKNTEVNIIYSDTDIHWMKNPIEVMHKYKKYNVCFQREKGDELGDYNCTGVMFLMNTRLTHIFVKAWELYIKKRLRKGGFFTDQEEANHLLIDLKTRRNLKEISEILSSNFRACTLDWDEFPSGINFFSRRRSGKGKRDKTCMSRICQNTVWASDKISNKKINKKSILVHHNFAKSNSEKIRRAKSYGLWIDVDATDWFD